MAGSCSIYLCWVLAVGTITWTMAQFVLLFWVHTHGMQLPDNDITAPDEHAPKLSMCCTGACSGQLVLSHINSRRNPHSCAAGFGWDSDWSPGRSGVGCHSRQCRRQCRSCLKQGPGLNERCRTHPCRGPGEGQQVGSHCTCMLELQCSWTGHAAACKAAFTKLAGTEAAARAYLGPPTFMAWLRWCRV